mgnify:CR=1 FL=1
MEQEKEKNEETFVKKVVQTALEAERQIRRQQLDGEIKVLREQILAGVQNEEHYKNRLQTIEADLKERQTSLESQEQEKSQLHAALLQAKKRQGDEAVSYTHLTLPTT